MKSNGALAQKPTPRGSADPRMKGNRRFVAAAAVATVFMLGASVAHDVLTDQISLSLSRSLPLTEPLDDVPLELGPWRGRAIPLDERVRAVDSFDDVYINRVYFDPVRDRNVAVFIGYVGRPRSHIGHRPDVCYLSHGATQTSQSAVQLALAPGTTVPAILYEFEQPGIAAQRTRVLSLYLINGSFSVDSDEFSSPNARNPGLLGERGGYLTRIQLGVVASADAEADTELLCDIATRITRETLPIMPYLDRSLPEDLRTQ